MRALEAKIPPPVVAVLAAALMWVVSRVAVPMHLPRGIRLALVVVFVGVGLAFGVSAMATFRRAKTTMNPMAPETASALVTHGVFGISRNPMYVSLVMYLLAWGAYLSNWAALAVVPLFALYIQRFQIAPEERALEERFGDGYRMYRRQVRRWL